MQSLDSFMTTRKCIENSDRLITVKPCKAWDIIGTTEDYVLEVDVMEAEKYINK